MNTDRIILWEKQEDCCGCSACISTCPVNAISMEKNQHGFYYPSIDNGKCVKCKKCLDVCAFKKDKKTLNANTLCIYAAKASDDIRKRSSSGGLFSVFSDKILANKGAIISSVYNPDIYEVEGKLYIDTETRDNARGSKYIQANMTGVFSEGYAWINDNPGKKLLFVGTGCQVAGFKEYAEKKKINCNDIVLVDLICNGVPSPGLWGKFAREMEKISGGKITYITFKDKRYGWHNPSVYGLINEQEVSIKGFSEWFYGRYSLRESCYRCPYTRIDRRSDITIGDYWGIEEYYKDFCDENGVSLAIIHTEKGQNFFNLIKDNIDWIEIKRSECSQPRLEKPARKPWNRGMFWRDINSKGIVYCSRKYKDQTGNSLTDKIKRKLLAL